MSVPRLSFIRRAAIAALSLVASITALGALLALAASADSCPNAALRVGPSAVLPDCRAFEMVTPEIKADNSSIGGGADGQPYGFPDGNHVYYTSFLPLPGALSGGLENTLSTRTASGWVTSPLAPPSGTGEPIGLFSGGANNSVEEAAFTADLSAAFVNSPFDTDPLDQDHFNDAYRMSIPGGAWSLAALPDAGPLIPSYYPFEYKGYAGTYIAGVSSDAGHVLFQSMDHLPTAPGTPVDTTTEVGNDQLYDRTGGHTYLVGVLPDGTAASCGAVLGDGAESALGQDQYIYGAIAPDGSNVVFTTGWSSQCLKNEPRGMYLREHNQTTVKLVGQSYVGRSSDGSKVFSGGGSYQFANGVYEYDVATGATTTISPEGWFVASSADGSRVYYLIEGGVKAGLYLWEGGASKLIPNAGAEGTIQRPHTALLSFDSFASSVRKDGENIVQRDVAVATPDGAKLLFLDTANLTGYNNFNVGNNECGNLAGVTEAPGYCTEAFVYNAETGSITCVSCNPTGVPPLGNAQLMGGEQNDTALPPYSEGEISADGSRVFFETEDALVPQDTNGLSDVYEWENGRIYLISSGQGGFGSSFSGASSDGSDVFITTTDHLAPQDIENSTQVYDARIDGGFPANTSTPGCDSGQCQGPQTPAPSFAPPASATFVGLGNPVAAAAAPAVKAKPKAKPKKKPKAKKKTKARRTARRAGRANGKRKGGK